MNFDLWFIRLQELAFEEDWELGEPRSYQEYYDDGDTPEVALAEEMSRTDDDDYDDDDELDELEETHEQEH